MFYFHHHYFTWDLWGVRMSNVINFWEFKKVREAEQAYSLALETRELINSMRGSQIYRPPPKKAYDLQAGVKEITARLEDIAIALKEHGFPAHADIIWDITDVLKDGNDAA